MKPISRAAFGIIPAVAALALALTVHGAAGQATPSPDLRAALGDDGVLTNCVDPSFPPMEYFENQNSQEPIGFDIDLVSEIGKRLGVKVDEIPTEFTGLLPALQAKRCDIIASGLYLTAERLKTFDAQPYYDTSVILLTRSDNADIHSPGDLAGKTVAVQSGTNYINILNDLQARLQTDGKAPMTIQTYPKQTDAIQQLVVGRAAATITQDTEAAFREIAQPGQFKIAYTYPDTQTFGIYYRPDASALEAALKEAVEAMRDDGTLAKIAEKWNLPTAGAQYTGNIYGATPEASPAAAEATPAS
jgi:polar amino acid transport system substrate-binding protein